MAQQDRPGNLPSRRPGDWSGVAERALVALLTACLLTIIGGAGHARAADDRVDLRLLRKQLFIGNERMNVHGNQFWIRGMAQAFLLDYRRSHAGATQQELVTQLAWYEQRVRDAGVWDDVDRPFYQVLTSINQVLIDAGIPIGSGAASAVNEIMKATIGKDVSRDGAVGDQNVGAWQTYDFMRRLNPIMNSILGDVLDVAERDRVFGNARDAYFGAASRASVYDSVEQFLANPILDTWINTRAITDLVTDGNTSQDEILGLIRAEFTKVSEKLNQMRDGDRSTIINVTTTRPPTEQAAQGNLEAYRQAAVRAGQNEVLLSAAGSAVGLLATLAGFADPKVGRQIGIVGNAAVQIASAVNRYLPCVVGLNVAEALTSLGTAALTGNLLAAVTTLLPLFIDTGPTPEQMILDEVRQLRQDVAELGRGMHDRFDRVEQGLSTIYNDMLDQFDKIIDLLGGIRDQLGAIQQAIAVLQNRLDELGQRLFEALETVHLRDLKQQINSAIGYADRYHRPLPESAFLAAENMFQFFATDVSRDAVSTAPARQLSRVANADIDPNIAGSEFPRSLAYLSWLAGHRFGHPVPARTVINPVVWSLAARAYARLMVENPQHLGALTVQSDIRAAGVELDALVRDISKPGDDGSINGLFRQLLENYRSSVREFAQALRQQYEGALAGRPVDLFKPSSQTTAPPAPQTAMRPCRDGDGALSVPASMQPDALPAPVLTALAGYRAGPGSPRLVTCYEFSLEEGRSVVRPKTVTTYGRVSVQVHNRLQLSDSDPGRVVRSVRADVWTGVWCVTFIPTGEENCADVLRDVRHRWDDAYRAKVDAATPTSDAPTVDAIARETTDYLRQEAFGYLVGVSRTLAQESTLRTAARAMTGAQALLEAYIKLGFPQALQQDELLSAMVVGQRPIVHEAPGEMMASTTYQVASTRYLLCDAQRPTGCTPPEHLYDPLWEQPYLTDGSAVPGDVTLPGDPVGAALVSAAANRLTMLNDRLAVYSRAIKQGQHAETQPLFAAVDGQVGIAESLIRAHATKARP